MKQIAIKTWPLIIVGAIASYLATTYIANEAAYDPAVAVARALGAGTGNWLFSLLIVLIIRLTGRLQRSDAASRAIWITGLILIIVSYIGAAG